MKTDSKTITSASIRESRAPPQPKQLNPLQDEPPKGYADTHANVRARFAELHWGIMGAGHSTCGFYTDAGDYAWKFQCTG
jgi:hypothetical protein